MPALLNPNLYSLTSPTVAVPLNESASTTNLTNLGIQVICAWPLSGQYGPGSRVLYYVLVAACIVARKAEWLRNACLAGALLFPVVAAIHGIALAAEHVDEAIDMDVYGAFQLCALGALVAPLTVRTSDTYGGDPGRNAIFVWALLVLAGLISLTVEFYRIDTHTCIGNQTGPINSIGDFPYDGFTCGLVCSEEEGPFSPLRGGSASNIYVIPAPNKFTFNAATLLAAACCIPAILLLVSTWIKILELNWKKMFASSEDSVGEVKDNRVIKMIRKYAMVSIFGVAIFAILVVGERNLFSTQVRYQTEPLANVGQWAPIAGTGLAVLGSMYLLLAAAMAEEREKSSQENDIIHILARHLICVSDFVLTPAREWFDDTTTFERAATDYPELPGEALRNRELYRTVSIYSQRRGSNESATSAVSNVRRPRSATLGTVGSAVSDTERTSIEPTRKAGVRRATLEVPSPSHRSLSPHSLPDVMAEPPVTRMDSSGNPAIVVSPGSRRQSDA